MAPLTDKENEAVANPVLHKGKKGAKAATREPDERKWAGARFVVDLPAADI